MHSGWEAADDVRPEAAECLKNSQGFEYMQLALHFRILYAFINDFLHVNWISGRNTIWKCL